jgi:lipoate---protein ligase
MRWRLLPFCRRPAALNMAVDEVVAEGIRSMDRPPTIRFYGWEPSAISIGQFQALQDEVDINECRRQGVDVVRRRTGGGAVYHDRTGEITYSVIAPEGLMGQDITASYRQVCGWVMNALIDLGLDPHYAPINDITVAGKKISGCAQTRRDGVFLQHGTVLYSLDREKMFSLLKVAKEKSTDKAIGAPEERVISVSELTPVTRAELLASLQRSFCRWKEWYEQPLSPSEAARAAELVRERYGNPEWTASR